MWVSEAVVRVGVSLGVPNVVATAQMRRAVASPRERLFFELFIIFLHREPEFRADEIRLCQVSCKPNAKRRKGNVKIK